MSSHHLKMGPEVWKRKREDKGSRGGRASLSTDAGRQTVPFPAAPGAAVLNVASVGQDGTVHYSGVVEALQRVLGTCLWMVVGTR